MDRVGEIREIREASACMTAESTSSFGFVHHHLLMLNLNRITASRFGSTFLIAFPLLSISSCMSPAFPTANSKQRQRHCIDPPVYNLDVLIRRFTASDREQNLNIRELERRKARISPDERSKSFEAR